MPRRRQGFLLPLEVAVLSAGLDLQLTDGHFYGFLLAKELSAGDNHSPLVSHGTLYKALSRLTGLGLVNAAWEDPATAEQQGRPRRRLYTVTADGERVLSEQKARTASFPATAAVARVRPA
jgi:DNA-binding PadR family transcriptional regulator